ncbi:hypothetical protein IWW36_003355 [Coemansia brasiliensis]|uniref:Uncharacterized protein n=1 Tax=Coemansia brasiliensis TaxID=2650707 RepID=A0A9W8LZ24_9FUNG|nr:hypothetical protein IWW36_003355 [Coemansia brasiliensis]
MKCSWNIWQAILGAACVGVAAADKVEPTQKAHSLNEQPTRGLHTNTGHIIFQSMTPTTTAALPAETGELSDLPLDESDSASTEEESVSATDMQENEKHLAAECLAAGVEDWDEKMQVGGVFIILVVSFLGVMLPIGFKHIGRLQQAGQQVFVVAKFFGAGVILATAFVHMLGAAIETLGDDCLEDRMGGFDSWPALLAMLAVLAMHLMDYLMSRRIEQHSLIRVGTGNVHIDSSRNSLQQEDTQEDSLMHKEAGHVHASLLVDDEQRKKLSTYILELGIALHSIIVGMTLAVTGGSGFKTLLAAISFHQFFEGMALGSRISALQFRRHPLLLCLANAAIFAVTTPLGQAIGIGMRHSFAPRSPSSLLSMGVLDGLSAGILMYSAIVNLLVEEFAAAEFRQAQSSRRIVCFAAMYLGCAAMSLIGKWA